MGILFDCCKKEPEDTSLVFAPDEIEINIQEYISSSDQYFTLIEKNYNLMTSIQLLEYMNLLEVFSIETATIPFTGNYRHNFSSKDPFLDTIIHQDEFQSFIENKLFNITNIIQLYGEDLQTTALFKECFLKIYSALNLKLNSFYNKPNKNEELIKKRNLVALGILFCRGKNISKIKLFFDLFKNDNNKFIKSENLDNYLMSCFFIASYCLVSVRALVDNEGKSLPRIDNRTTQMLLNEKGLAQKNSENLLKYFNNNFFGENKDELDWDEFKKKFISNENQENKSFGWILSTQGIRSKLEDKEFLNKI
jgi:hypothetical protein